MTKRGCTSKKSTQILLSQEEKKCFGVGLVVLKDCHFG